ncbi:hypothetical protein Riv7116_2110 [Rivularia sp. PCC 7116]|uniref:hypothetical protein n=1 Tax=Rivularia sp. PCC 7116 TaxID=373994 RepID=UPI00029EC7C2|nr:hypothetical protein [Rivularia sp. PCC 7116]AFY54641.1 hypothetical protein Riv7116_2110 [Rivularia sp. PCC 7116]
MTQSRNKSISQWTYKHDEFCLQNSISPAAKLLWQWLIKKGYIGESEPDLKDFNKWVSRNRSKGAYCRNTLKDAFNKLVESRAINLVKKYTWNIVKIVTRPIEYLKPKKKLQKRNIFDSLDRSKQRNYDNGLSQQQHIRILDNQILFSQYGIHFDDTEKEVLDRPKNEILLAIVCYQLADETRITQCTGVDENNEPLEILEELKAAEVFNLPVSNGIYKGAIYAISEQSSVLKFTEYSN